ncbi:MAG: OmpA family protein [Alphaproteobacteria bacterium]|nr:OmpA family protein [Alphaproteobacteria bacterium]MDP6516868.1 OmpA family protein [Alphaproteobacteria bacterium]
MNTGGQRGWLLAGICFATAALLAGCSAVPDELNPVEWVSAVTDWVEGGDGNLDPEMQRRIDEERARGVPGSDDPFPSLASVPDERPGATAYEQRQAIAESLIADREHARYIDDPVAMEAETALPWQSDQSAPVATAATEVPPPSDTRTLNVPPASVATRRGQPALSARQSAPARRAELVRATAFPIQPPPVAAAQDWSEVEQVFYRMFAASGGAGDFSYQGSTPPNVDPAYATLATGGVGTAPIRVSPGATRQSMHAAVVYFGHSSARLSREDHEVLRQVAAAHSEYGGVVRVVGHASSRTRTNDIAEHKIANYEISVDRARAVAEELISLGVAKENLFVDAMADTMTQYSEATPMGEAANRRTDIYLDFVTTGQS